VFIFVSVYFVIDSIRKTLAQAEPCPTHALNRHVDMSREACFHNAWSASVTGVAYRPGGQMCCCQMSLNQCYERNFTPNPAALMFRYYFTDCEGVTKSFRTESITK